MRSPLFIISAFCILIAAGCTSYHPVDLIITDRTGAPVAGASVHAAPMYFFNPEDKNYIVVGPYDIVEPFPADGDAGITDLHGHTTLKITEDSPFMLNVYADGFIPWKGQISITEQNDVLIVQHGNGANLKVRGYLAKPRK